MQGRIEKKVFSDYSNAKELIEKSSFFGLILHNDNCKSKKYILIKNTEERLNLINIEGDVEPIKTGIFGYIDFYSPDELFVFENLKEATEWLYRDEKQPPTTGQYHQYPTSGSTQSPTTGEGNVI